MFLSDEQMLLRPDDVVITDDDGHLKILRTVVLNICRCRTCQDACKTLARPNHVLCVHCNNHHSQMQDGNYVGPFRGPR